MNTLQASYEWVISNFGLSLFASITWWTFLESALGAILGFWITLFVMPLVPGFIEKLTNKPNWNRDESPSSERDYPVSEFGFFTELKPGRVKIIERGGDFVRCIMNYEGFVFKGEIDHRLKRNDDLYWEVTTGGESHPIRWTPWRERSTVGKFVAIPFFPVIFVWWLWKRWVFMVTGYAFTGIYPFQRVRTYPLEYFRKIKQGDGKEEVKRIEDYSDHFRVADFQFPVRIPSADTRDKIPVRVFVELMARVFNPFQTAYWIDDWSARLSAAAVDSVTHFTRARLYDDVISIRKEEESRDFSNEIKRIGNDEKTPNNVIDIGIKISQALIIDISPVNAEDGHRLGEVARARVDRDSMELRADGRAAEIRKQSEAVKANGHIGLAVLAAERNVRTAEAAGNKAVVVIGGGGEVDPINAAILQELKGLKGGDDK